MRYFFARPRAGHQITSMHHTATTATRSELDILQDLNRDYIRSVQHSDVRRFDEILADDFLCSNPDGSLDRSGGLPEADRGARRRSRTSRRSDVVIRIMGDVAIIHARTAYTRPDGQRARPLHGRVGPSRRPVARRVRPRHALLRGRGGPGSTRAAALPRHERGHDLLAEPGELLQHDAWGVPSSSQRQRSSAVAIHEDGAVLGGPIAVAGCDVPPWRVPIPGPLACRLGSCGGRVPAECAAAMNRAQADAESRNCAAAVAVACRRTARCQRGASPVRRTSVTRSASRSASAVTVHVP